MRGSPFFEGVSQTEFSSEGQTARVPVFHYDGAATAAPFRARLEALRRLIPDHTLRSVVLVFLTAGVLSTIVAPATAVGGVLRVPHRAVVASCTYVRGHDNARTRARAQFACRLALRHSTRRGPVRARAADASWYQNPVSGDTADPAGLNNNNANSDYYLYATGYDFPIQHSTDLVGWTSVGNALTQPPQWVAPRSGDWNPWSPSVLQADAPCPDSQPPSPSCYYMYYVGKSAQFGIHCVAVATSPTPGGPFTDRGPLSNGTLDSSGRPIGCGDNAGYGNIDPAPFVDMDGKAYLYVSTDYSCSSRSKSCTGANSTLRPTISVIPLAPDLVSVPVSGARKALFSGNRNPDSWENAPWAPVVEGPWMEKHNGTYYLFYSGGAWTGNYGMGDATMSSPLGPATKDPNNPILYDTPNVFSPGGGSTIIGPRGGDWMLYHARLGGYTAPRQLFIDPVVWHPDGSVTVSGPTTTPQSPAP